MGRAAPRLMKAGLHRLPLPAGIRRSPYMRAWGLGIRDYWLGHFGECPAALWELQREWKAMNKG